MGHLIISRAETKRYATLPDLGLFDCPSSEGPTECKAVILIMSQGRVLEGCRKENQCTYNPFMPGKTNDGRKIEYGAMIRNANVETCGVGGLGLYLFSLYHVEKVKFPDFSERKHWYEAF
jgi:hypothetical protein